VWSRTQESAQRLAATFGVPAVDSFDALLDTCDAVAFCVPPTVQPDLAVQAARAGKAMLLEKPLGADIDSARRVADAVGEAGVGSVVVLTYRFADGVKEFLTEAKDFEASGGRGCFLSGAFLGGPFAQGWRIERDHAALLDVGPHIVDLMDAALGPACAVAAHESSSGWADVVLEHESGAGSVVSICCRTAITPNRTEVELFGASGSLVCDARARIGAEAFATLRREFAAAAASRGGHPIDAAHALRIQEIVCQAMALLDR
jgi:predicted dehydrogenase